MATRKPLVNNAGQLSELPVGDTVPPESLGANIPTAATVLFGDGTWRAPSIGGTAPTRSVVVTINGITYTTNTYTG